MSDPSHLPSALTDPSALLGALQTPEQQGILAQLNAMVAAFVGYVDHVVATVAPRVISSAPVIAEATKRRRVEESEGARLVERLFGLELGQAQFDRGHAFVQGVIERAGDEGLDRLWRSARELPTPNEVDAPGLWLARIDMPLDDTPGQPES
jgi:putative hydrolase